LSGKKHETDVVTRTYKYHYTDKMSQEIKYACKACGVSISTGITLVSPPVHKCQKRANRAIELEVQDETGDSKRRPSTSE
jgi:hypothetical protein